MNQSTPEAQNAKIANAFRVAAVVLGAALVIVFFYLFIAWQLNAWQMYTLSGIIAAFSVLNAIALLVIRQGHVQTGSWMLIIGMVIVFPAATLLVSDMGIIFGGALILLTLVVANQTLSSTQVWRAMAVSLIVGILTALIDIFPLSYRLYVPQIQIFVPAITVLIVLITIALVFRQSSQQINSNLRLKITVWTGGIVVVLSVILVAYSVTNARQAAIQAAEKEALALSQAQAYQVQTRIDVPMLTARTMALSLKSIQDPTRPVGMTRQQVNAMLKQVAADNPSFLATYTLWEPNAFDGQDSRYRNTIGHDSTGRFIPYWVRRSDGTVTVEPLRDYETQGVGNWYLQPRLLKRELAFAPLVYSVNGVDTVMASFVVPIVQGNVFYGIAGVDAPISFVQSLVDEVNLYNGSADALILSSDGFVIGFRNRPELVSQPVEGVLPDFADLRARVEAGQAFVSLSPDGNFLRVFAPVEIGDTGLYWSYALIIPFSEITALSTLNALREIAINIGLLVIALAILWAFTGQVVRPILALTQAAGAISAGNFEITANVESSDETGILASAFNSMTGRLREFIATLEQRVEERTYSLQLASEVGRSISQVRSLDDMLRDAAEIIRSRFNLYYVQVYLPDSARANLILESGTGSVGAELLGRAHRLPLNTASINGRAAVEKRPVVIADTSASPTFRPNPLLPDTRSEMSIPLLIGDRLVGVLDMQSQYPKALSQENLPTFEALAGQLAIAIQNASLLADAEQSRAELENQARRLTRVSWHEHLDAIHKPEYTGFAFEKNEIIQLNEAVQPETENQGLVVPIAVGGEPIGALTVDLEQKNQTSQAVDLVNIVARQVAQQLESLRLLESAERYRIEAEQASRLQTRQGWLKYIESRNPESMGYYYNANEVKPLDLREPLVVESAPLTLPLKVRDETVGKLAIFDAPTEDIETLGLAGAIMDRLGAHIESLRLFEETRRGQLELDRRARQLQSVAEISTASSRELDVDKMLEVVVNLTQRRFELYHAHVFTYNVTSNMLEIRACGWKEGDEHEGTHGTTTISLDQEQSLVARAGRTRQPVIVNDVHSEPGWLPNPLLPDTASELAVPLLVGDQLLGVLDVQSDRMNEFTQEDASIQSTLASQIATALQNAYSFARAQRQAEREAMLNTISQKIQSATSVEAVLQIAARELGHALGAPRTIAQLSLKDKQ